jgi:hypothetical protein
MPRNDDNNNGILKPLADIRFDQDQVRYTQMPIIQDLVVDIGLTIRRLKSIAHGGRVLISIPAQAAGRIISAVRFAHPIEARRRNQNGPSIFQ